MGRERATGLISRIFLLLLAEYAILIAVFLLALRISTPTPTRIAGVGAILFTLLSVVNFRIAARIFRSRTDHDQSTATHLAALRDDFLYLRWYFDELLEMMSSAVIVLDRLLTVRSMNHAGRDLLALREKEELIGRPFRHHPLSKEIYNGIIYNYNGKPLIDILDIIASDGDSILIDSIEYHRRKTEEPFLLDILVYPWKNQQDETERLVIRLDNRAGNSKEESRIDLDGLLESPPAAPSKPPASRDTITGKTLLNECVTIKDHLNALLASSRSAYQAMGPEESGPKSELFLFELQVKNILGMIGRMESEIDSLLIHKE